MTARSQQGSATILAVVAMIFLGIVIAGLLPMLTQELRSATTDRDVVEARYVAEAGVKRAMVALDQKATDWAWLTNWRTFAGDSAKTYRVVLDPPIPITPPTKPANKTTYKIYSDGKVGTITWQAYGTFTTPQGSNWSDTGGANPPPPLGGDGGSILDTMQTSGYVSYNIGSNLTIDNKVTINGGTIATSATTINNNSDNTVATGVNLTVPAIPVSLDPATYSGATQLGNLPSGTTALAGTYIVNGSFNTNSNTIISATGGTTKDVTIYATGNININDNIVTNGNTNLTLISNGSININSNVDMVGNIQLYAKEDLIISSNSTLSGAGLILTGFGLFMAGRDLYVNSNVNLNKAVLIASRDLYVNSNSSVTGQIIAGRNMILNSNCTITLAPVL